LSAEITGVNENLKRRLGVILRSMASGYAINIDSIRKYALQTAKMFVSEYPWYYMPTSVHRILLQGADVIECVPLPIGMMSEEALEARNKDFRKFRLKHCRKTSRTHIMEDLMNSLHISSDPLITSLSKSPSRHSNIDIFLDEDVKNILCNAFDE